MSYDWEKIFKEKTDKELYRIFIGKEKLNKEAKIFAEKELKTRNFNFKNIEKHKKKWELENLIEEEKTSNTYSFFSSNENYFLMMGVFGLFFMLMNVLDFFFNFMNYRTNETGIEDRFSFIFIGSVFTIIGFIGYKNKKRRKKYRKEKIKDLIREI